MKIELTVQQVSFSFKMIAASTQATSGVKLHTTPTVDTVKYFIALYEINMDAVDCIVLKASAPFAFGSTRSYMTYFSWELRQIRRIRMEMVAFIAVICRTSMPGFSS